MAEDFYETYDNQLYRRTDSPTTTLDAPESSSLTLSDPFTPSSNPGVLESGQIAGDFQLVSGNLQSANFATGSAGWQLQSDGDFEGNSGTFRGTLTATTGTIGGWTIGSNALTAGSGATTVGLDTTSTGGDDIRIYAGSSTASSAPFRVTEAGALTATSVTLSTSVGITGVVLSSSRFIFGGDGTDGALSITSGTTTIDCANADVVVKNYTSISITGTGKLAFSNPGTNGTAIILKSQGAVTLTSSTSPCIDGSSMGAAGGAAQNNGSTGLSWATYSNAGLTGTNANGDVSAGTGGAASAAVTYLSNITGALERFSCGGGGGGGGNGGSTPGAGGRGGGAIVIECGGALNFTGTVSVAGANGSNANNGSGSQAGSGGGGGGGGGSFVIIYKTLTASSGTITKTGGNGGAGGNGGGGSSDDGGGGGSGGANTFAGGAGGNGGDNASGSAGSSGGGTGGGTGGAGGTISGGDAGGGGGGGGSAGSSYIVSCTDLA